MQETICTLIQRKPVKKTIEDNFTFLAIEQPTHRNCVYNYNNICIATAAIVWNANLGHAVTAIVKLFRDLTNWKITGIL